VTRSPRVGISIVPYADSIDRIREVVRVADEEGLRLVGIQDHPYQRRFLDTFALVATLLADTRRASLFTDVANLPLRPGGKPPVGYLAGEPLAGPPDWWAETLTGFAADGFDTFVFWPIDPSPGQVGLLAREIVPLLSTPVPDRGGPSR
jgi:hypothetical protein